MKHKLMELPFALDALEPYLSEETIRIHYGKHHAAYVKNLNELVKHSFLSTHNLDQLVMKASGAMFNNAAQVWNHNFYWRCLQPDADSGPRGDLERALTQHFGAVDDFRKTFTQAAQQFFGSGWVWLVKNMDGTLQIVTTGNADTPLRHGQIPLLTCDAWEHAYYIDYRNRKADYLDAFWNIVNWDFVNDQLHSSEILQRRTA